MKAVVCSKYGSPEVFQLKEIQKPIPKDDEILIKIKAVNITISDCIVRSGKVNFLLWLPMRLFVGFKKPRRSILGLELSGEVEAIGKKVKKFKPNDQVIAFTGKYFGAYAEYVCLPENGTSIPNNCVIVKKPSNLNWEEAAAILTRGTLAFHYFKKAQVSEGENVMIYGASGGVGTYAVQLAKMFGAYVTGVCSTKNLDLVKSLGADRVIDYTKQDFTKENEKYDLIFDAVGKNHSSKIKFKNILSSKGHFSSVDDGTPKIHIHQIQELLPFFENGTLKTIIDKIYTLEHIKEAHEYVEKGHKSGHIVIKID